MEYIWAAKQARRREDDIAIVTSCIKVKLDPASMTIEDALLAYGGMGPTTLLAKGTSEFLKGQ